MSTIAEILEKQREKDKITNSSTTPVDDQTDPVTVAQKPVDGQKIPVGTPQVTVQQSTLPEISKEQMENIRQGKVGFWDVIDNLYKPESLDEKALARNRMFGSIGDSIKLLAQMYGAGKGAYIRENKQGTSLTDYFLNEENQLRDIYRQRMDTYNKIRLDAAMQEYARQQAIDERKRVEVVQDERDKRAWEHDMNKFEKQREFELDKFRRQKEWDMDPNNPKNIEFNKTHALRENQYKASNAVDLARVNLARENANKDTTKEDVNVLYAVALNDQDFLDALPDSFYTIRKDPVLETIVSKTLKNNAALIANAYKQYLEQKNNSSQPQAHTAQKPKYNYPINPAWGEYVPVTQNQKTDNTNNGGLWGNRK